MLYFNLMFPHVCTKQGCCFCGGTRALILKQHFRKRQRIIGSTVNVQISKNMNHAFSSCPTRRPPSLLSLHAPVKVSESS